ncbi:MAG: hypothetical protein HY223_05940 [Thaumarchaeota archaeon]|nr:hypothetical protein [Nitrososphaerota archaeon]
MKTLNLSIIVILAIVFTTSIENSYAQHDSLEMKSQQRPLLVISQVELYGPVTSQEQSCEYNETIPAHQWFELYNPTNADVRITGYDLNVGLVSNNGFGSSESSDQQVIELPTHKKCIFGLFSVGQDYIPDPRNVLVKLAYHYNNINYTISTPPLTDTYNDTRTWKLSNNGTWVFVAPSPLEQLKSGIIPEEILCNGNFALLINKHSHTPACVLSEHVIKLESLGWFKAVRSEYIPVLDRTYDSGPGFGCPFIFPHIVILNSSGFETYNYSGIIHNVLKQGKQGTFVYNIYGDSYGLDPPIFSPNKVDIRNNMDVYFQPDSNREIKQDTNSTIMVSFEPKSEIIDYNGHITVVVKISASSSAPKGTYWLNIVPGTCSGTSPIPIVIGDQKDATDVR